MRKGQFFFNYLRDYMGSSKDFNNPYPNCHRVFFNISDEYWEKMEEDYKKMKRGEFKEFPKKPFGDSIISKEHESAMKVSFRQLIKDMKAGVYDRNS